MIKLFNTLSRETEQFQAQASNRVKFYSCGPTVYDHQTIGNLRTYVFYDTLKRFLVAEGYKVDHVMNITDVGHLTSDADEGEDKLERGARKAGKTVWEIAEEFTKEFKDDLKKLNIPLPKLAKATAYIAQQIEMVELLLKKGFAYHTKQAIYFDVTKLASYGELTGQKLAEKETAAREGVITDPRKKHPQDFALWFFRTGHFKHHVMFWKSPWGEGFPGWHLECSAIIHETLEDPIDIHSGAVDLIGTHHTNEMAQTQAAFGHKLASYWIHSEHLLVDNEKMAKSLGNFYTLKDVVDRGFAPLALRLLYLSAHYRSRLNFTWDSLAAAQSNLENLYAWADLSKQDAAEVDEDMLITKVASAMADDLNTPRALSAINTVTEQKPSEKLLTKLDDFFGLDLAGRPDLSAEQKDLLESREQARENKDWVRADDLRRQLEELGVLINDTPKGPIWSRRFD
jgi:cysteinyl-tRNA synthetase